MTFASPNTVASTVRSMIDARMLELNSRLCLPGAIAHQHFSIGVKTIKKNMIRADVTKVMVVEGREEKCPRFNQIRFVAFFNIAANGPNGARALTRKILGNEEYCMQIDAHTSFVPNWDEYAKTEWKNAENEFAIISTTPASKEEMSSYESWTGAKNGQVPRQCLVRIADNDIPVSRVNRMNRCSA
jgi:hypothetical protein